jgi:Zn-dependent protease
MPDLDWSAVAVSFGILLVSLSVHECAHAWTALQFGDSTALALGRVSLNPIRHIDPVGTLLFPALSMYSTGGAVRFGWAKPVPVNPYRMKRPGLGITTVSFAGPASNLVLALFCAAALGLASPEGDITGTLGHVVLRAFVETNVALAIFNLIPLTPLDGGGMVAGLLPRRFAPSWAAFETIAPFVLIGLLVSGVLSRFLGPAVDAVAGVLFEFARGIRG